MNSKYDYLTVNGSLTHHGILGQRWGKRNGPPYPLDASDHSASEKKAGWRKSLDDNNADISRKKSQNSTKEKTELTPEQIEYRKKIKRIALATAGVVGVGAAGYLAYKSGLIKNLGDLADKNGGVVDKDVLRKAMQAAKDDVDFVLPKGTTIRRTTPQKDWDVKDARDSLYTTFDKKDAAIYRQLLRLRDSEGKDLPHGTKIYEVSMELQRDYKIATKSTLEGIFEKLKQDPEFVGEMYSQMGMVDYIVDDIKTNKNGMYDTLRSTLSFDDGIYQLVKNGKATDQFRNAIKNEGFDGIIDYFDKGTMSEAPVIMFDKSSIMKTGEKIIKRSLDGETGLSTLKDGILISKSTARTAEYGQGITNKALEELAPYAYAGFIATGAAGGAITSARKNKQNKNQQNKNQKNKNQQNKESEDNEEDREDDKVKSSHGN